VERICRMLVTCRFVKFKEAVTSTSPNACKMHRHIPHFTSEERGSRTHYKNPRCVTRIPDIILTGCKLPGCHIGTLRNSWVIAVVAPRDFWWTWISQCASSSQIPIGIAADSRKLSHYFPSLA